MWWFLFGLLMGTGVMRFVMWLQTQDIVIRWYMWLMGALSLFLATLTVQHFFASLQTLHLDRKRQMQADFDHSYEVS